MRYFAAPSRPLNGSPAMAAGAALAAFMCGAMPAAAEIAEIVVVAQKREQALQEVPIAISAFNSDALSNAGIRDIRDLAVLAPSLVLSSSQSETAGTTARIRGIGTTGDNLGLESSVAVFVDGVYRNRNNVALTDLGDLERIEVLRGPQGTLFGKNASAGLIHIITKAPDLTDFSAYADASFGNYDYLHLGAGATGPAFGGLGFRLDATASQRDGFIDDRASGAQYNDRDRYLVRGQLGGELTDGLDLRLILDYANREETCCAAVSRVVGPTAAAIALLGGTVVNPPDPYGRAMYSNRNRGYDQDVDEWGASAELNWETGIGTVTSITAYRDWDAERSQDIDFTDADILYRAPGTYENEFETFSQELRLAGQAGPVEWLVGAFFINEELTFRDAVRTGGAYEGYANLLLYGLNPSGGLTQLSTITGMAPGTVFADGRGAQSDLFEQDADSWALFTHNIWSITDALKLTLGLRYTDESKDLDATLVADNPACDAANARLGAVPALLPYLTATAQLVCTPLYNSLVDGSYSGTHDDEEWTGTIALSYQIEADWLAYVSYGRGYKAGGFNLDRAGFANPLLALAVPPPRPVIVPTAADLDFDEETVDAYEIGSKTTLREIITVNVAAFYQEFDDFQLNSFTGTGFTVSNLPEVTSKGVELEWAAAIADGLTLNGGATYTNASYGNDAKTPAALRGRRLTNAPFWVVTAAASYEQPITAMLTGFVNGGFRFNTDMNTGSDLDVEKEQASYAVVDAAIGFRTDDDHWVVELWGRNIFDRDYAQVVFDAPLQGQGTGPGSTQTFNAFLGDPATWGLSVRANF
ncbi:MAG: TonB-dependent receptor [Gammaproteobacteria bacterium]|nr:MAG: TonB-dependent receptor [Gammaproteobacteria bacterium]